MMDQEQLEKFEASLKRLEAQNLYSNRENRLFKKLLIPSGILLIFGFGGILWGDQISVPNLFTSGTLIRSSDVNANFSTIYNHVSTLTDIAVITDQKAATTPGGSCIYNSWNTRILNTIESTGNSVALNNNQITFQPGKYLIQAEAAAHAIKRHKLRLRNISASTTAIVGMSKWSSFNSSDNNPNADSDATLKGFVMLSAEATFELQHFCGYNGTAGDRFGVQTSISGISTGEPEIFATVLINKIL